MRVFILFSLVLFSLQSFCQGITITGKALDRKTLEPLVFASVGIKGKPLGTVTNLEGAFDFHLPQGYQNEFLVISMLGYVNFEAPVWSLTGEKDLVILMDISETVLKEIQVSDSLHGGDILKIALASIPKNFPSKPFFMEGFYRDLKKIGGDYVSLLEAAVNISDDNYEEPRNKSKLREKVKLIEVRKSLGYENKFAPFFDQGNLLEDLLLHNNIRYRQIDSDPEMMASIKREKDSFYNGHEIYVVSHREYYNLRIFIDKVNYAIIRLEFEKYPSGELLDKRKGLMGKDGGIKKTIEFKSFQEVMYLSFINITSSLHWHDAVTDALQFQSELYQQLLINAIEPDTRRQIKSTERMRNFGLQYQDLPYNKKFWESYNVIKETPLDLKIISDLERHLPLEQQFEN